MAIKDIFTKARYFGTAARREQLQSPELIQKTKAVRHPTPDSIRRAKIQTDGVQADYFSCRLLDKNGDESGNVITVKAVLHLGINDLDGNVWPDLSDGKVITVFKDVDGNYYTTFVFDDKTVCL